MKREGKKEVFVKFNSMAIKENKFKEDPKRIAKILKVVGLGLFVGVIICLVLTLIGFPQTFADIFAILSVLVGLSATTGWVVS